MRAPAGAPPLDRPTVEALGETLAAALGPEAARGVLIGGDTRESTPTLSAWLAAGLAAGGVRTRLAGVMPTPGIAFLVRELGVAAAISVSASHNPYPDNGIKLLDASGFKWSEAAEAAFEQRLRDRLGKGVAAPLPAAPAAAEAQLHAAYLRHLAATVPQSAEELPLAGLRIVLDAGNGAASPYLAELFGSLGATVVLLCAAPDGRNVNAGCGSTAPERMASEVVAQGAHLGAAFDGDADRCILADERGVVRDGDAILYLWAGAEARSGQLPGRRIVATSMSNLGLERALASEGIAVVRCGVGDREVVATMQREGIQLGGEQSGHIVDLRLASTGDGMLTAVQMAALVARQGRPLSALLAAFRRYPQILLNIPVARKVEFSELPAVASAAQAISERLGEDGRLVLRYSGTEPLARVMIEGPEQAAIEAMAAELGEVLRTALGTPPV